MSDIQDLEQGIKEAEELIVRRQAAVKLYDNREFKLLFVDGLFSEEAARLVQLSSDPALNTEQRADALAMAQSTGHTKRYLSMAVQMGAVAEREIEEMRSTLDYMRAHGDEE